MYASYIYLLTVTFNVVEYQEKKASSCYNVPCRINTWLFPQPFNFHPLVKLVRLVMQVLCLVGFDDSMTNCYKMTRETPSIND